jgi:dienelactone hydrolase
MRLTLVFFALLAASIACGSAAAQQKVQFPALDGKDGAAATVLDGYLFQPDRPGPHPTLVFMHGCGGLFSRTTKAIVSRETAWRQLLVDKGFAVLMVDGFTPRETGEMCSRTGFKEWLYLRRPGDAYAALLYLQAQSFVLRDRIGLIGWSNGGGAVLMAVASQSRGRPPGFAGPDFRAAVAFYPGSCSEQRLGADWTTSIPLLILIGQEDVWTPAKPCQELAQDAAGRGAPVTFHAYSGAYHDFDWPGLKRRELTSYTTRAGVVPITGEDPAARADALDRVTAFLTRHILN